MSDLVFYHCSDIHLGKTYADSPGRAERYEDFFRVFAYIIDQAVAEGVDAVAVAGDLFHYPQILPRTLARAVEVLRPLRAAGIPLIAIDGNHDWIHRRDNVSWIEALSDMGYLHLLRPVLGADGRYAFPDWDPERRCGGHLEVKGVHFYGVGYIGALAGSHVGRIVEAARATEENVLLFHVGVWGYCGTETGNMTPEESLPLSEAFRYVALGHGHRSYDVKTPEGIPFAYNPGSPERVNFGEADYRFKGFHRVRWVPGGPPQVAPLPTTPRPMIDAAIALDGACNVAEAEARVRERLAAVEAAADERRPVVRVKLTGRVGFRPVELSRQRVTALAEEALRPLHVEYENALWFSLAARPGRAERVQSLSEVEREVVQALFTAQSAYQPQAERLTRLALQVKESLCGGRADAAELLEVIHRTLHAGEEAAGP